MLLFFQLCAQYFLNVRGGGGITTLGVFRVLLKRWTAACQSGSFAIFRGQVVRGILRDKGACPLVNTSFDTIYNHLSLLYSP